jgi:LysR family glycine cleavage system transcriptional activator
LLAFESAARHGSITAAASELNLTQSAVSRQIRQLEDFLDVGLFQRVHQRVLITDAGKVYLTDVARILKDLGSATHRTITCAGNSGNLNLAVLPMFATRWLVPRLPDFVAKNADIMLNLAVRTAPFDFSSESLDGAIHYGHPNWPGAVAHYLMEDLMVPVCSPKFRKEHGINSPDDLSRVVLLHQATRLWAWPDWFQRYGITKGHASRGPCFEQCLMLSQAAVSGLGAALLPRFVIEDELANGSLVRPVKHDLLTDKAYYFVVPESKATSPLIQSFSAWLVQQAKSFRLAKSQAAKDISTQAAASKSAKLHAGDAENASKVRTLVRRWEHHTPRLRAHVR